MDITSNNDKCCNFPNKHQTCNIKITESNSPILTKRSVPTKKNSFGSALAYDNLQYKKEKNCFRRISKAMKCYIESFRNSIFFLYYCCNKIWVPIMFILWMWFFMVDFFELILYWLIYLILLILNFVSSLIMRIFAKFAYLFFKNKSKDDIESKIVSTQHNGFTTVLDLDETLIYTTDEPPSVLDYDYFTVNDHDNSIYYVYKRPHLDNFLKRLSTLGRIIVFTASEERYATQVINNIAKSITIEAAYFRNVKFPILQSCIQQPYGYVKKLKNIGLNLKKSVIVDDSPISYKENSDNAIAIKGWQKGQEKDRELLRVIEIIEQIHNSKDVRKALENIST